MQLNRIKKADIDVLKDGMHADGGNLYLRKKGQARSWVFRYRNGYATHELGLGSAWVVTPTAARCKAAELRLAIAQGKDPSLDHKRAKKEKVATAKKSATSTLTLNKLLMPALEHKQRIKKLRTPDYAKRYAAAFKSVVAKALGNVPLADITPTMVAETLTPYLDRPIVAAVLATIRCCYSYAYALKGYSGPNPTVWQGGLSALMPSIDINSAAKHRKAVKWQDIPQIYKSLCEKGDNPNAVMLRIIILMCARSSEIRNTKLSSIEFDTLKVTYPTTKTSGVPVTSPMTNTVAKIWRGRGKDYAIENAKGKPLNEQGLLRLLKAMLGDKDITVHGFRSSFSTWCADNGKDPTIREMCLGHAVESKVALAYQRSDLLNQRRALLQEWNDYVTSLVDPE